MSVLDQEHGGIMIDNNVPLKNAGLLNLPWPNSNKFQSLIASHYENITAVSVRTA